jgi:hypothetical protein
LLDRFVQAEPWLTRDKVMIDSLKTIGVEKGKAVQTRREDEVDSRSRRRAKRTT